MSNTHTWRPGNTGYMFDPANYLDGTSFTLGNTLNVHAGHLGIAALPGSKLGMIRTGTFIATETGGADEDLTFNNVALDAASSLTETGKQKLYWYAQNQFVNGGLIQVGSAMASCSVYLSSPIMAPCCCRMPACSTPTATALAATCSTTPAASSASTAAVCSTRAPFWAPTTSISPTSPTTA